MIQRLRVFDQRNDLNQNSLGRKPKLEGRLNRRMFAHILVYAY
jgi:hypothetical protein